MPVGREFVWYVFQVSGAALDQKNTAQGGRPNVHGSALRGLSCMACTLYHAACTSVNAHVYVIR